MATKAKFTDTFIQKLELPAAGKREFYQDTLEPNLYLKVTSAGKVLMMRFKFLGIQYDRNLSEQRNVYQARIEVGERKVEIRNGNERLEALKAKQVADKAEAERVAAEAKRDAERKKTLGQAVEEYLEARSVNVGDRISERTAKEYRSLMAGDLAPYKDLQVDQITREKSIQMLNEIATGIIERSKRSIKKAIQRDGETDREQRTGARANYSLRLVRSVCNFTGQGNQAWGKVGGSAYPWIPSKPKVTALDPEYRHGQRIWQILGTKRADTGASFLMAILMTGCRRGELADLKVCQVNLETDEILLKDTKNGSDHRVFIAPQLRAVLEPLLFDEDGNRRSKSERVFPTTCDPRKLLKSVGDEIGVEFGCHSLRKFFAINCMSLGIPLPIIKGCLNHSMRSGDVTMMHYAHPTAGQMRNAWQRHADTICPQNATVIDLDAHRRSA